MDITTRKYAPLWNKYRPAILRMMLDAEQEPQRYQLMHHEFQRMDGKKKGNFGFTLTVTGSKAVNNIRDSETAQDLLNVLQGSPKGSELMKAHTYEIKLDKQFTLHVSRVNLEPASNTN